MNQRVLFTKLCILLVCSLSSTILVPLVSRASLTPGDHDDLLESLVILSTGWVQEHVDKANSILSSTAYTAADWQEFFSGFFGVYPLTFDLYNYLGYPVLWWFGEDVHINLQLGLVEPLEHNIDTIVGTHHSGLGAALDVDTNLRETLFNSHRFLNDFLNHGAVGDPMGLQIYGYYTLHIYAYPHLWSASVTHNPSTVPYVASVRAQVFMNLGDALPLTSGRKDEIAQSIGLSGPLLGIWFDHSVLVVDNNGLDETQLEVIDTLLSSVSSTLHNLRYITVNEFLGNEGVRYVWFRLSSGVNIFGCRVGESIENGFPDDVAPKFADVFSLALAHEVNHIVDAHYIGQSTILSDRRDSLIETAGDAHMNYLRSMFEDGFFTTNPQEFFASIANQYFADSALTLSLGVTRWESGYRDPINQFLFFAEVYGEGGSETPFYTIDTAGVLTKTMVPIQRDANGHIDGLLLDGCPYYFDLDGDGNVTAIAVGTPAVFRIDDSGRVFADQTVHAAAFSTDAADVAEWISIPERVEAGDVLELDPTSSMAYRLSRTPCSSLVAGVVSTAPGVALGGGGQEGEALLALVGIVPVKVSNEGGPIQPGDLLVTSSTPGHAMRWAGTNPCPCALVGKALEPMTDEAGVILVLLTAH